ncbi:MAG TPA: hypothetical protein VGV14_18830 [Rhodanobacter sp.]|nr:hypothetical protein [Rhodanobacter sp.]
MGDFYSLDGVLRWVNGIKLLMIPSSPAAPAAQVRKQARRRD